MSDLFVAAPAIEIQLSPEALAAARGLADDEFVLAHRHSEWLGLSPFLEEDLVMASIAQDELGHARGLYSLLWPDWADRDALLVRRPAVEWRSCALVELGGLAWEESLVRHVIYDVCEPHRWRALQTVWLADEIRALSERVLAEEQFHRRHGVDLLERLSRGGDIARARLQAAVNRIWPLVPELMDGMRASERLAAYQEIEALFVGNELTVEQRRTSFVKVRSERSADFAEVAQMLVDVVVFDPTARW